VLMISMSMEILPNETPGSLVTPLTVGMYMSTEERVMSEYTKIGDALTAQIVDLKKSIEMCKVFNGNQLEKLEDELRDLEQELLDHMMTALDDSDEYFIE